MNDAISRLLVYAITTFIAAMSLIMIEPTESVMSILLIATFSALPAGLYLFLSGIFFEGGDDDALMLFFSVVACITAGVVLAHITKESMRGGGWILGTFILMVISCWIGRMLDKEMASDLGLNPSWGVKLGCVLRFLLLLGIGLPSLPGSWEHLRAGSLLLLAGYLLGIAQEIRKRSWNED